MNSESLQDILMIALIGGLMSAQQPPQPDPRQQTIQMLGNLLTQLDQMEAMGAKYVVPGPGGGIQPYFPTPVMPPIYQPPVQPPIYQPQQPAYQPPPVYQPQQPAYQPPPQTYTAAPQQAPMNNSGIYNNHVPVKFNPTIIQNQTSTNIRRPGGPPILLNNVQTAGTQLRVS